MGGRGSAGGNSRGGARNSGGAGGNKISAKQIFNLPEGSKIEVENFSAITGKSTGSFTEYTLANDRWSSVNRGSFTNDAASIATLNSRTGNTPEIRLIRRGR